MLLHWGITLTAQHLPRQNIQADFMSRHLVDSSDWMLNSHLFQVLNQQCNKTKRAAPEGLQLEARPPSLQGWMHWLGIGAS